MCRATVRIFIASIKNGHTRNMIIWRWTRPLAIFYGDCKRVKKKKKQKSLKKKKIGDVCRNKTGEKKIETPREA